MLDGERSYVEYGVIVDRTSDGLGYYLAWTSKNLDQVMTFIDTYDVKYPVSIQVRRVSVTGWKDLS